MHHPQVKINKMSVNWWLFGLHLTSFFLFWVFWFLCGNYKPCLDSGVGVISSFQALVPLFPLLPPFLAWLSYLSNWGFSPAKVSIFSKISKDQRKWRHSCEEFCYHEGQGNRMVTGGQSMGSRQNFFFFKTEFLKEKFQHEMSPQTGKNWWSNVKRKKIVDNSSLEQIRGWNPVRKWRGWPSKTTELGTSRNQMEGWVSARR